MLEIESFDEETVNRLRNRAATCSSPKPSSPEERLETRLEDLLDLEGMDKPWPPKLAQGGVHNRDDLADLAVDELMEMSGLDEERAKNLITKARAHWFDNTRRFKMGQTNRYTICRRTENAGLRSARAVAEGRRGQGAGVQNPTCCPEAGQDPSARFSASRHGETAAQGRRSP